MRRYKSRNRRNDKQTLPTNIKRYDHLLRYLTLSLFTYGVVAIMVTEEWVQVFYSTIIPTIQFNRDYALNLLGWFTTIAMAIAALVLLWTFVVNIFLILNYGEQSPQADRISPAVRPHFYFKHLSLTNMPIALWHPEVT